MDGLSIRDQLSEEGIGSIKQIINNTIKDRKFRNDVKEKLENLRDEFYKHDPDFKGEVYDAVYNAFKDGKFGQILTSFLTTRDNGLTMCISIIKSNCGIGNTNFLENQFIHQSVEIIHNSYLALLSDEQLFAISETLDGVQSITDRQTEKLTKIITKLLLPSKESPADNLYMDSRKYRDQFDEVLFLHKSPNKPNHEKVTLRNLYVMPEYSDDEDAPPLDKVITDFVRNSSQDMLIIEGDAGIGKSSLCYWLNAHDTEVFGERPLITVRLRELDKEKCQKEGLFAAILNHMQISDMHKLKELFPNAIFLLDGFDELCLIHSFANLQIILNDFSEIIEDTFKVIITSRPNYIPQDLRFNPSRLSLHHFSQRKREEWLNNYKNKCGQQIDEQVETFLLNNPNGICDTPFMLYLLASENDKDVDLSNNWAIFHRIFHNSSVNTEYYKEFRDSNGKYRHPIRNYVDAIYRINEELAYQMYRDGNTKLFIRSDELTRIVQNLAQTDETLRDESAQEIVKHSYALCTYWKTNSVDGAVEFYHNNIRDFFLCEKIYREINAFYDKYTELTDEVRDNMIDRLCGLFQYGQLNKEVCEFLRDRTKFKKGKSKTDYPFKERERKWFPVIIEKILTDGRCFYNYLSRNPIEKMSIIVLSIFGCYLSPCYEFLDFSMLWLRLWNSVGFINGNCFFKSLLRCHYFMHCNLRYTDLSHTDLSHAYLLGADLFHAYFFDANLSCADLSYADLSYAYLFDTDLSDADLREAKLSSATLPDGFSSPNQDEQIAHLRSLKIPGLKI